MPQPYLIGNLKGGLVSYFKPWLLANDAFANMNNAFTYRGRVIKRPGIEPLWDTTTQQGAPWTLPTALPVGPVMGLLTRRVEPAGTQQLIAFNTTKAYAFNTGTQLFNDISGVTAWTGGTTDFFWSTNFANSIWVVNGITADGLRYYYGTTWQTNSPVLDGIGTVLNTARMVFVYKGRLVVLNTTESSVRFPQRARWCQIGTPYATGTQPAPYSLDVDSWRQDISGKGGFIDVPTGDVIVSAEFNKDTLIVFCQRSTWKLAYTGNPLLPFVWNQINDTKGADCQFSRVSFDRGVVAISQLGIVVADQINVDRIDQKIVDEVEEIANGATASEFNKVAGIRDHFHQLAYWTFDKLGPDTATPQVLVYNYVDESWAINSPAVDQTYTTFGSFFYALADTWQTWANKTWQQQGSVEWRDTLDNGQFVILVGDADGNVYIYSSFQSQTDALAPSVAGAPVITNYGFDISTKRFNPFLEEGFRARLEYVDLYLSSSDGGEFTLEHYVDDDANDPVTTQTVSTASTNQATYVRVYLGSDGLFHQLRFYLTNAEIADPQIGAAEFEIQAMVLWFTKSGRASP